jgi:2-phosphoxylose phosphatase
VNDIKLALKPKLKKFTSLVGILLLIRHGVRASLNHVRDNSIDCSHENDSMLTKYRNYLLNSTLSGPNGNNNGHAAWNRQGPFHGFPMLPADSKICLLGQLTYKGISQLLHVGELMRFAYAHPLDLFKKPPPAPKTTTNSTENPLLSQILNTDEIVVYSTRYRRTFQSAMALLYNLLPTDRWHNLQIQESHSLAYCFSDCACPNAENLKRQLSRAKSKDFTANPTVASLVNWIGTSLLQSQDTSILNPLELRDVLLMYLCHNQELPCQRAAHQPTTATLKETDSNDIIDLDDGQMTIDAAVTKEEDDGDDNEEAISSLPTDNCIEQSHVETLLTYTNLYELRESNNRLKIMERLLRAYGLMRNIVNYMLKMISGDKLKMVLYSSHDQTIQNVLAAIGLLEESSFIPYATRMSFEVYRSATDSQHYFRLLYNGKDVTRKMSLCLDGKSLRVNRNRGRAAYLCPIENIIRFIHDDYFSMLNATNFKDACFFEKSSYI